MFIFKPKINEIIMKMERILKDLEHISELKEEMERSRDGHQETVYEAGWGQEFRFFFSFNLKYM